MNLAYPAGLATEDLYRRIAALASQPTRLMEVCGTHTVAASRSGLRAGLPSRLKLLSGPGCPVCVTPCETIDRALAMAEQPGVTVATFGDIMRVPGSSSTLAQKRACGCDIRVVYSPSDALRLARELSKALVVFLGIGFETTAPAVGATLVRAANIGARNFLVLAAFKRIPPAMCALAASDDVRIDGFLCPGHVSTIIGVPPYEPLAAQYAIPCVVSGFAPMDMLESIAMLLQQRREGRAEVENQYQRAVQYSGNREACRIMDFVFRPCDGNWRGLGTIRHSGLEIMDSFREHDACHRVPVEVPEAIDLPNGCSCGEVLRGLISPSECKLFGRACTPQHPVGPCMVSSEGACAAHFRYGS